MRPSPRSAIVLCACSLAACTGEVRDVSWEISFGDASLRERAVVVVAEVYEGSCGVLTTPVWSAELAPGRPTPANEPPALSSGRYAFRAAARDVACREYATACVDVELPDAPMPVRMTLVPGPAMDGCPDGCLEGLCVADDCPLGTTECDGDSLTVCDASLSSASSCGACFVSCSGATPLCGVRANGTHACADSCAAGTTECGTTCADLARDARNCGACGTVCPPGAHGVPSCVSSACTFTCEEGYGDCNRTTSDGCETSFLLNDEHCGGCGIRCGAGQRCLGAMCFGA